jgi:hypothetical protein
LGVKEPKDGEIKEKVKRDQAKSSSQMIRDRCIKSLGRNNIGVHERNVTGHGISSVHIRTTEETLAQSGGCWRTSWLQRGSITSPSRQNKVIAAGGRRDGAVSRIFGGLLRHLYRAGLFKVHIVQGFVTFPGVIELAGIGALRNGVSTPAELGLVEANQSSLAKVLQLVQVNT